tara:strand:+ start:602 stop:1285 length:684 start_codon:yes stop_codon:yes gene_type:complete
MPITFLNVQNMKAPYTPENVAEITYDIVSGFNGVSKVRLNKFNITINCWDAPQDNALASVTTDRWDDYKTGVLQSVIMGVVFDGKINSMVEFGHELVHVAQFASKRLRKPVTFKNNECVIKSAFAIDGKVVQKGITNDIGYADRMWEWEAWGLQSDIACAIYGTLIGGVPFDIISREEGQFEFQMAKLNQSLLSVPYIGWESFPVKVQFAFGDAKRTDSKTALEWKY